MSWFRMAIKNGDKGYQEYGAKSRTLKYGIEAFIALFAVIWVFLASYVVGVLIAIPLAALGLFWLIYMPLRGRLHLRHR